MKFTLTSKKCPTDSYYNIYHFRILLKFSNLWFCLYNDKILQHSSLIFQPRLTFKNLDLLTLSSEN